MTAYYLYTGHKTFIYKVKIQQYYYTKGIVSQGTLPPKPTLRQRPSTLSSGKNKQKTMLPQKKTGYKQEQTWTLYSPF